VLEQGLNGRNTVFPQVEWRCGLDYLMPCLITNKPIDAVVLMLGTNDLRFTDAKGASEGVRRIVEKLYWAADLDETSPVFTAEKPKILLVSPIHAHPLLNDLEPGDYHIGYPEKSREFIRYYEPLAKETGCWFLNAALYGEPCTEDGLHMTLESHPRLAKAIAQKVREMVG